MWMLQPSGLAQPGCLCTVLLPGRCCQRWSSVQLLLAFLEVGEFRVFFKSSALSHCKYQQSCSRCSWE